MPPIRLTDNVSEENEAIFRSAPMTLVQFYVTIELARDMVGVLGDLGNVQFRDLNSKLTPFQRTFMNELRGIESMMQQLNYLYSVMEKQNTIKSDIYVNLQADTKPLPTTSEMDEIKTRLSEFHQRIKHLEESFINLDKKKLKCVENRSVLNCLNDFHRSNLVGGYDDLHQHDDETEEDYDDNQALLNERRNHSLEIGYEVHNMEEFSSFNSLAGTISRDKVPILRNILWRTLRGNLYFHDIPLDDEKFPVNESSSEFVHKNVFIIFIHGDFLKTRVRKIIQSLDGILFDNANGGSESRLETLNEINSKIEDLNNVVESTKEQLVTELMVFQELYPDYCYIVQREKLIYEALNKFDEDSTRRCLVGEGWIPSWDFEKIRTTLRNLIRSKTSRQDGSSSNSTINLSESTEVNTQTSLFAIDDNELTGFEIEDEDEQEAGALIAVVNELSTNRVPPTYHKTNKFTAAFQSIIDAYGIATYQEVNPGLATIITFPFMFSIMFGDVGHGFIVLLMALYLIKNEISFGNMRNKDEIFEMAFSGRYIILLMGVFSIYTGLIYNDIFSKSMNIFSSGWKYVIPENYDIKKGGTLIAEKITGKTYPFGLDWAWHGTENNLLFTNSYKMKLSVLMGYTHMNYSLMFSLVNYLFFKSRVDIIGNFIPGFLFMQSIFGYLSLTIVYKWSVDWFGSGRQPPGLLNMLINMFLSPGTIEEPLYPGQKYIQIFLVLIAAICVPWLLIYKPLVLKKQNDRAIQLGYSDLHSQRQHSFLIHEEERALELQNNDDGLNHDPPESVFDVDDDDDDEEFRFPNDVEPMFHSAGGHGGGDHDEEGFNFGDIVIHQVIHTIEFCLNCVSHTASYLRLWALSLAHAQLSTVLWSMTIQNAFGRTGAVGVISTVVLFAMWFSLTVCILVFMEGTSAMLHSLRLHWVEAMSKFFQGEGYAYEPFTFKSIDV
ncbi:Vacuolar ATP synthase subunit a [Candida maltosa Xu316]|uniref:V-type proton ATPase subunit a n=1 Tax=Candida maltosa (strain Xu316) TaxID=1245528 RepID=M3IHI9_CANMX|nr:Vacuolar ATP synthase subunit a [Candida maltosa Xu316]